LLTIKSITLKKYLAGIALLGLLAACGGGTGTENKSDTASSTTTTPATGGDISSNPDYKAGLKMVASSDCLTCHDVSTDKIGPAYQKVADKWAGVDTAVDYLAKRVINGTAAGPKDFDMPGVMTPHPTLSMDSARQMVKYVLLLKTK
jgi:cytochrome c